jgi:hypothetical protein
MNFETGMRRINTGGTNNLCLALVFFALIVVIWAFGVADPVQALDLRKRVADYPNWKTRPALKATREELSYPKWMAGTWQVESTLIEQFAPLVPDIVTPGFEQNRRYLQQPIIFRVRFLPAPAVSLISPAIKINRSSQIIADRAFNGLEIGRAYLGREGILSVTSDPEDPNQYITQLANHERLITQIIGRQQSSPERDRYLTSELTQQFFQGDSRIYLNIVETTTNYHQQDRGDILADQLTAIYLSPKDPQYFLASNQPVALYRYQLHLTPLISSPKNATQPLK